jgi:hypothetical protein
MNKCCTECFNDKQLKIQIVANTDVGRCMYCKSDDRPLIEAIKLADKFEFLILATEKDLGGDPLHDLLNQAFAIFSPLVKNPGKLLSDILGHEVDDTKYVLKFNTERYKKGWDELCEELKHNNRFFPKHHVYQTLFSINNEERISPLFSLLEQLEFKVKSGDEFFRARISDNPLSKHDMGPPPSHLATSGRANPNGISYVYLADNVDTCISEVRPYNGCEIHVSQFTSSNDKTVIDLRTPRKTSSIIPFPESQYGEVLSIIDLLESFEKALSVPIKPHLSELEYIPTQFLCEYIKSLGSYDGIIFKSSFGKGDNYVFFDKKDFVVSDPTVHSLNGITFEHTRLLAKQLAFA